MHMGGKKGLKEVVSKGRKKEKTKGDILGGGGWSLVSNRGKRKEIYSYLWAVKKVLKGKVQTLI